MTTLLESWQAMQRSTVPTSGGGYSLKLIDAGQRLRVYAAVSEHDGTPALLIELPAPFRPADLARITTRSFDAFEADLPGLPSGHRAIVLQLKDAGFLDLFAILGEEIRAGVTSATGTEDACRSVLRCIDRWRRFVDRGRRALTEDEVRGLLGELVILARCVGRFGPLAAVDAWRGPTGSLRDFELPDFSVEVKTFQSDSGAAVRISDPQQLDVVDPRPVFLAVIRLAKTQAVGLALPEAVALVRALLAGDTQAAGAMEDLLAKSGYLDAQATMYGDRYMAGPTLLHAVGPAFPRIAPESVPGGVVDVHYSLLLASLVPFRVDPAPLLGPAVIGLEIE